MARGADESNIPSSSEELDLTLPVHRPYWLNGSRAGQEGIRATWIGHATVLAEVDGTLVLTGKICAVFYLSIVLLITFLPSS